jgi:Carboxypeptidase regulatory-like domain
MPSGPACDWRLRYASLAAAVLLASCGGGGGDDPTPPPPGGGGNVSVSGKVTYDSVPPTSGGSLNYAGTTQAPIRGATIQLVDAAGGVVGSTTSNAQGDYTLSGSATGQVSVRVLAELKSSNYDFTVRDNTDRGSMWGMASAVFAVGAGLTQNVHAPSGWNGTSYTAGQRVAGPFAILDIAYLAKEKIAAVAPSQALAPLKIFWSPNNVTSRADVTTGQIGTSFFTTGISGDEATTLGLAAGDRTLFILGQENNDTDEYDTPVIAHEIGHYLQSVISRDDSIGGNHGGDDLLDMRVAFSEGWGNSWSSMVRDNPVYFDSRGARQSSGFQYSVASVPFTQGWYSEGTVEYLLWGDYADTSIGFAGIFAALADMSDSPYLSSIYEALRAARPAAAAAINSRAAAVGVHGTDGYGTGETNNGGVPTSLPVYGNHNVGLGTAKTYCVNVDSGKGNKLNNYAFVRFTASGTRTIRVARAAGTVAATDPEVREIITSQGQSLGPYLSPTVNVETTPSLSLPSGTHLMIFYDYRSFDSGSTGTRCFDVTIN